MPTHPTQLPQEPSGTSKETNWFRNLVRAVRERSIEVGPGLRASYGVNRTLIELAGIQEILEQAEASELQRFLVTEDAADYMECVKVDDDGVPYGSGVLVARPLHLRRTGFHGTTVNYRGGTFRLEYADTTTRRCYDADNRYFDESIWPPYVQGDSEIYGMRPKGKPPVFRLDGTQLEWLDINVSSRIFEPNVTKVQVCQMVNGVNVTRYMYVAGGPIQV